MNNIKFNYCKTSLPETLEVGAIYFVEPEQKFYVINADGEPINYTGMSQDEEDVIAATLIALEKEKLGEKEEYVISKALNDLNQRILNVDSENNAINNSINDINSKIYSLGEDVNYLYNRPIPSDSVIVSGNASGSIKIKNTSADSTNSIGLSTQNKISYIGDNALALTPYAKDITIASRDIILGSAYSVQSASIPISSNASARVGGNLILNASHSDDSSYSIAENNGYRNIIIGDGIVDGHNNINIGISQYELPVDIIGGHKCYVTTAASFNIYSDKFILNVGDYVWITTRTSSSDVPKRGSFFKIIRRYPVADGYGYEVNKRIDSSYMGERSDLIVILAPSNIISGNSEVVNSINIGCNVVSGNNTSAFGHHNYINSNNSLVSGINLVSRYNKQFVYGYGNSPSNSNIIIGSGINNSDTLELTRSNVFEANDNYVYIRGINSYDGTYAYSDGRNSLNAKIENIDDLVKNIPEMKEYMEESAYVTAAALTDLNKHLTWNII